MVRIMPPKRTGTGVERFSALMKVLLIVGNAGVGIPVILGLITAVQRNHSAFLLVGVVYAIGGIIWLLLAAILPRTPFANYRRLLATLDRIRSHKTASQGDAALAVLQAFANHRLRQRRLAIGIMSLSLGVYIILSTLFHVDPSPTWAIAVLTAATLLLLLSSAAMEYRLRRGWYGTNEYEARQIVHFLLARAGAGGFSGGLGSFTISIDEATTLNLEQELQAVLV
jgi:hypothetical protein